MNTALIANKVTLTIPGNILQEFKKIVGLRKMSQRVSDFMQEQVRLEKQRQAFSLAKDIAKDVQSSGFKTNTQKIINSYKNERKY